MTRLLVLRPEPGASQTVAAARSLGLEAVAAPLYAVEPLPWRVPLGLFDALMLTSANAVRWAGEGLAALRTLPVYAVGEATAAAARAAGLDVVHVGSGGAGVLAEAMQARGVGRALHLAGEVHRALAEPGFDIVRAIVYRSAPVARLPARPEGMIVLIHSPDAGCLFARLMDETGVDRSTVAVAAISDAAASRMGDGWAHLAVAPQPTDAALLAIAAKLCEEAPTNADGRM